MKAIGQKLKAIFSLKVDAIVGCNHKSDYTLMKKQYDRYFQLDDLPGQLFHDVSKMAIDRGIVKRGPNQAGLQSLCRKENLYLAKDDSTRVGTTFASTNGHLSNKAQLYCQHDVEAPLVLHQLYQSKPDLTMRISKMQNVTLAIGQKVDIMPQGNAHQPIAQGTITQVGGRGQSWGTANNIKLSKGRVLVKVSKVFNKKGIIHYPCDGRTEKRCACMQKCHGIVTDKCDFYTYSHLGQPPYIVSEYISRLRFTNDLIDYPACVFETQQEEDQTPEVLPLMNDNTHGGDESSVHSAEDTSNDNGDDYNDDDVGDFCRRVRDLKVDITDDDAMHDDEDGTGTQNKNPTEDQVKMATNEEFNQTIDKIIEEADKLSEMQDVNASQYENRDLPSYRTVLGDIFHFMDRAKVPMHHEFKALYFRALRAAVFIMNSDDVAEVKAILESKPDTSWDKTMAFNFPYIARRVRRIVAPPHILYNWLLAVYKFFKDKVDSKTGHRLMTDRNQAKFENMLKTIKKGYASDPPNMSLYLPKTDRHGRVVVDEDGLTLYRSIRGTSNLESLHQYLTTSFGHTVAGPYYSDSLLMVVRHHYNWRTSKRNRPGFPQLLHYNGLLVDRINNVYEQIYGYPKYENWEAFNDNMPTISAYGIVSIENELTSDLNISDVDEATLRKNNMLRYLAERQGGKVPFLPIRGENERKLVH